MVRVKNNIALNKIRLFVLLLLASCTWTMNAQNDEVKVGLRAGHNAAFGGFAAVSLERFM